MGLLSRRQAADLVSFVASLPLDLRLLSCPLQAAPGAGTCGFRGTCGATSGAVAFPDPYTHAAAAVPMTFRVKNTGDCEFTVLAGPPGGTLSRAPVGPTSAGETHEHRFQMNRGDVLRIQCVAGSGTCTGEVVADDATVLAATDTLFTSFARTTRLCGLDCDVFGNASGAAATVDYLVRNKGDCPWSPTCNAIPVQQGGQALIVAPGAEARIRCRTDHRWPDPVARGGAMVTTASRVRRRDPVRRRSGGARRSALQPGRHRVSDGRDRVRRRRKDRHLPDPGLEARRRTDRMPPLRMQVGRLSANARPRSRVAARLRG